MIDRNIFGVGSVWSVYSCLNWTYSKKYRENLNKYRQLRALLTGLTKHYIPKKSGVISAEKIKELLTKKLRKDGPFELLTIVTVALAYFGLLRKSDILMLKFQDMILDKKISWSRSFMTILSRQGKLALNIQSLAGSTMLSIDIWVK